VDVGFDRCVGDVFEIEDEEYNVVVLVFYRSNQYAAEKRRTCANAIIDIPTNHVYLSTVAHRRLISAIRRSLARQH